MESIRADKARVLSVRHHISMEIVNKDVEFAVVKASLLVHDLGKRFVFAVGFKEFDGVVRPSLRPCVLGRSQG